MNLSTIVLLGLAVIWAIVLIPEGVKRFGAIRRGDSIRSFNEQLSVLDKTGRRVPRESLQSQAPSNVVPLRAPRPSAATMQRAANRGPSLAVRRRRQSIITSLATAAIVSLIPAVAFGGAFFVGLHLVIDLALAAYLVALMQVRQRETQNVARQFAQPVAAQPVVATPRRVAN